MPKVSVIMSVYNGQRYLREAIDSILNQTFSDFEFIIVNDGSTDRTTDILASYRDPRIKIINQPHLGIAAAKNKALKISEGKYIAIMDADDISLPQRLETQVEFLEKHKEIGALSCSLYFIDEKGRTILLRNSLQGSELIKNRLQEEMCFYHPSSMIRKEVLNRVGGYRREFRYALDYDLFLRISEISKLENIREPLYKYRIRVDSISIAKKLQQDAYAQLARICARERKEYGKDRLKDLTEEELKRILRKLKREIKNKKVIDEYYFWAKRFYWHNDYKMTLKYIFRSLIYTPLREENLTLFFKTIFYYFKPKLFT